MPETNNLAENIKQLARGSAYQRIVGRNALVKHIFEFLVKQAGFQHELLFLCTRHGLILSFLERDVPDDISGHSLELESIRQSRGELLFYNGIEGYVIAVTNQHDCVSGVTNLQNDINALVKIFDTSEGENRHLLNCLDSMRNAISIYDRDANLIFANSHFCKYFCIDDRDAVIGMNICDIMDISGLNVHSMENNSSRLKLLDVLKEGKEALDWEVRLESQSTSGARLASNDMYPVLDMHGEVEGLVELARSHQQDMKRTRKILGLAAEYSFNDIIGSSHAIRDKIRLAKEYAKTPFNLFISGESGVGKELFAQAIHNCSAKKNGPFVALNCASIPEGLIESELFGYVGGAFTGASKNGQVGKFELADGGTLFLDEIGELPYHFQSKLLRVLETWMVTRIGSTRQIPVNVRLIAATNRNLDEMAREGLFRKDLYYRLQVLDIEIPPLRERREDILLLAESFLKQSADPNSDVPKVLDAGAQKALLEYDWPGNVRELRNVIYRTTILSKEKVVTRDILGTSMYSKGYMLKNTQSETPEHRLSKRRAEVDESYANLLKEVLDITKGNKKQAAELLGVSRKTFYRMMEKHM